MCTAARRPVHNMLQKQLVLTSLCSVKNSRLMSFVFAGTVNSHAKQLLEYMLIIPCQ